MRQTCHAVRLFSVKSSHVQNTPSRDAIYHGQLVLSVWLIPWDTVTSQMACKEKTINKKLIKYQIKRLKKTTSATSSFAKISSVLSIQRKETETTK